VAHGLRVLAFTCIRTCLHDFAGTKLQGANLGQMRQASADAIHWLRDTHTMRPFSFAWCVHVLDIAPEYIQEKGLACVPGITLKAWRDVRAHREDDRTTRLKRKPRRCEFCGRTYMPGHLLQQFCDRRCAGRALSARRPKPAPDVWAPAEQTRYARYVAFCQTLGVPPWTEQEWIVMCS
jgi:hypothetical protein